MHTRNITEFLAKSILLRIKYRDERIAYYEKVLYTTCITNCHHDVKKLPMCKLCKKYPYCRVCTFTNGLCIICTRFCKCGGENIYDYSSGCSSCLECTKEINIIENGLEN